MRLSQISDGIGKVVAKFLEQDDHTNKLLATFKISIAWSTKFSIKNDVETHEQSTNNYKIGVYPSFATI